MKFNADLLKVVTPVVVDSNYFVKDLFQKKFGSPPPEYGNHLIGFYRNKKGHYLPVTYISLTPYKRTMLVGGAMTDGDVIKQMTEKQKNIISQTGGVYFNLLKYAFERFANDCDAFFGYVNDPRALEVDLAAGFKETDYQYVVANFHKSISSWKKKKLFKVINKLGSF